MKRLIVATLGTAVLGLGLAADGRMGQAPSAMAETSPPALATAHGSDQLSVESQTALVGQYCATCHSDRAQAGGLTLAFFDAADIVANAAVTEKMIRKLRAGMMPPAGARRPDEATLGALTTAFETRIDTAAAAHPNPGWRPFQRMNRAEYGLAVRDLLAVDIDVSAYLPPDTISDGFDNVADVQAFSPALMDGYLRAASQISRLAVGDKNATATSVTYKVGRTMSQMRHIDGAPIGTRGGISVVHTFPADGDYVFKINLHNEPLGGLFGRSTLDVLEITEQVEISIDGARAAVLELNTRMSESDPTNNLEPETPRIHVKAGPHRVSAAFIRKFEGPMNDLLMPVENTLADVSMSFGVTLMPHLRDLRVIGPHTVTGVSETPSRRKIFSCRPTSAAEESACAAEIVRGLARQAFRGPVGTEDFEGLMAFYEEGRKAGDFESGIRFAVQAILASPQFLFRAETVPGSLSAGDNYRLTDLDLASRLSFFLWSTVPDAELLHAASEGVLRDPEGLEAQVRRMLEDPRSESLSRRFAGQWLRLQDLDGMNPDYLQYPNYDDTLAEGFRRETELFFDNLIREDRSLLEILTADYSFVNARVAEHYGIPNVTGNGFQRVQLPPERRGILGQGSILTLTSIADRTSPVIRGKWVMEVLLGSPPPPPPPNVPALDEVKAEQGTKLLSVRERMEQHRANPACASCHKVIDPLGLALENFDVTGRWRIKDNEVPIDPTGELYDGTPMDGPEGLRTALMKHQDAIVLSFTESLMTYALGRRVEYYDMPAVRTIVHDAAEQGNRMSAFILGVIRSPAFRMSTIETTETVAER